MLEEGRLIQMILMLGTIVSIYLNINAVRGGKKVNKRPIAALDAIPEGVGRAAEQGRTVHFTPGYVLGGMYHASMGPGYVAGISILKRVAEYCAQLGTGIIVTLCAAEAVPICDAIVDTAYRKENLPSPENAVRFISTEQYAFAAGVLSIMREERPGATFNIGFFWSEALQFAEAANYIDAFVIAGSPNTQIPVLIASSDYVLIGEEIFAAKSYIEEDPAGIGSLVSSDLLRVVVLGILLLGLIGYSINLQGLIDLLNM